jgi:restriction endonuclease S subunit
LAGEERAEMSRLDELVQELCPNGVTYKKLVDAVSIERGKRVVRSQLSTSGKYPVYQNSLTPLGYHTDYNYNANTTFIIVAGAAGEIGFSDKAFWAADDCFTVVCPENVLNRYIYHLLLNNQNQLASKVRKASIPRLSRSAIENLVIPIPPLDVQREIVRILDNFTNLTAELTAELTARKNQYEFYRDKLLTYDSKTKIMPLKDVAEIERGTRVVRSQLTEDGLYPVFQNALTPMGYNDKANRLGNNTFLICAGAAGQIGYSDVDFWAADDCYTFKCCEKLENRYLFHVLKNNQHRIDAQVRRASIPRISREAVGNIRIPIPPLDVQNRIVNVLDNFEKICSDLNIGLPAEIEARQKQYEYYRDKLLTFAETGNTILNGTERNGTERNGTERNGTLIKLLRYVFGYVRIPLGDVGSICMCKRILKSQTNTASGVPFYKIGTFGKEADAYISQETFDEYRSRYNFPKKGDVLISAAGTIGRTVVYDGKPAYFQDSNIVWIDNDESIVLNSYLRYCYELKPWKASEGGTIPRLYNDNIAKAVIAIPSIEKQKRIVSILDRFDAICNDLTSGLPAEIEARRKQYEYYRDKLLSFKELI